MRKTNTHTEALDETLGEPQNRPARVRIFMFREILLAITFGIALALSVINMAHAVTAVSIKHNSLIENDVITLGDVFNGVNDEKAKKVLGPAPRPGHDMTLSPRTLLRIAIAMDLPWRPTSNADQVTLSSASTLISTDMIEQTLIAALQDKGLSGNYQLLLTAGNQDIVLPKNEQDTIEIEEIAFDTEKNRFDATIVAPSKENPIKRERVSGVIQYMAELPVLNTTIRNGQKISSADIDFISVRVDTLNAGYILDTDALIGMTPRRILAAGKPIRDNDIQAPQLIKRGDIVTMTFNSGTLALTAQGKAMENGARGDTIRVVNASSNKTLQATIVDAKEVSVTGL